MSVLKTLARYIRPEKQRKLAYLLIGLILISNIWFISPAFGFLDINIYGNINIRSIVSVIAAYGTFKMYQREL